MSRTFPTRTKPVQTTRQQMQRQQQTQRSDAVGAAELSENNVNDREGSPSRRERRGDGYTMFPPNPNRRQQMQDVAQREEKQYEEHRQANRPYFSEVGTVGDGVADIHNRVVVNQQNVLAGGRKMTPMERARIAREQTKQREQKEFEEKKQKQRDKAVQNKEREKQRNEELDADRRRKNEAFLDKIERKASVPTASTLSSASSTVPTFTSSTPASVAASSSSSRLAVASASASSSSSDLAMASASASSSSSGLAMSVDSHEDDDDQDFVEAMRKLECLYPYVDQEVLELLLKDCQNDVNKVVEHLS